MKAQIHAGSLHKLLRDDQLAAKLFRRLLQSVRGVDRIPDCRERGRLSPAHFADDNRTKVYPDSNPQRFREVVAQRGVK